VLGAREPVRRLGGELPSRHAGGRRRGRVLRYAHAPHVAPLPPPPPRARAHACTHVRAQGAASVLKRLPHLGRCAHRSLAVQAKGCRALAHAAAADAAWSTRVRDAGGVHDVMEAMRVHQVGPARPPPQPRALGEHGPGAAAQITGGLCPARAVPGTAAPRAPRSAASAHAVTLLLAQSSATVQHEGANFLKVGLPPLPLPPLPLWPWEDAACRHLPAARHWSHVHRAAPSPAGRAARSASPRAEVDGNRWKLTAPVVSR